MVLETAVNGSASRQVTLNLRHFGQAASKFGIMTMTPASAGGDPQSFLGRRRGPRPIHQCCSRGEAFSAPRGRLFPRMRQPRQHRGSKGDPEAGKQRINRHCPATNRAIADFFALLPAPVPRTVDSIWRRFKYFRKSHRFSCPPCVLTFSRGDLMGNQPEPRRKSAKNKPLNIKSASFFHFRIILPQNLSPTMAAQYGENNLTNIDAYFIIVDR
jgi:hypothetical protein